MYKHEVQTDMLRSIWLLQTQETDSTDWILQYDIVVNIVTLLETTSKCFMKYTDNRGICKWFIGFSM